jgi:hypothetical protein
VVRVLPQTFMAAAAPELLTPAAAAAEAQALLVVALAALAVQVLGC